MDALRNAQKNIHKKTEIFEWKFNLIIICTIGHNNFNINIRNNLPIYI